MVQIKQRATTDQIVEAIANLRAARKGISDLVCGDTVLARKEVNSILRVSSKLHTMICDLKDHYRARGGEWPMEER